MVAHHTGRCGSGFGAITKWSNDINPSFAAADGTRYIHDHDNTAVQNTFHRFTVLTRLCHIFNIVCGRAGHQIATHTGKLSRGNVHRVGHLRFHTHLAGMDAVRFGCCRSPQRCLSGLRTDINICNDISRHVHAKRSPIGRYGQRRWAHKTIYLLTIIHSLKSAFSKSEENKKKINIKIVTTITMTPTTDRHRHRLLFRQ